MIVAVESNFVLELAFSQEEASEADRIVTLAEERKIELLVPACCLFEPYETLVRRRKTREDLRQRLRSELRELARCAPYADLPKTSETVTQALTKSGELQAKSLSDTIRRLTGVANVLPLTSEIVARAIDAELTFQLSPQDAVVFATVERSFREQDSTAKVFANKNRSDFFEPEIQALFQQYQCKLLPQFSDARQFIEHHLARA
jgi:predicted nucleic acid-binding protein